MWNIDYNCWYEVGNCVVSICSSGYDIGTDVFSAYRYLDGQNVETNETSNNTFAQADSARAHTLWGSIMLFLMFMPGLYLSCTPSMESGKIGRIKRFLGIFFPIYTIGYGFYALRFPRNVNIQRRLAFLGNRKA